MTQQTPFEKWWYEEGSQAPYTHHDFEEHTKRMCEMAWANCAYKEREACESIEYDLAKSPAMFATMAEYKSYRDGVQKYRAAIRARGEA